MKIKKYAVVNKEIDGKMLVGRGVVWMNKCIAGYITSSFLCYMFVVHADVFV